MSKDQQTPLIDVPEGVDLDVAEDPENSRTVVTGMTISASEKVSTGDYENYEPFHSLHLALTTAIDISEKEGQDAVSREVLRAHRMIQNDLQTAVDNRLSDPSFEDWPEGMGHE